MLTKTMSSCCCCCNADFFFFLFPLSFLTSFMSSTQNLTYLYHDCPNTTTFDCNTTSTPPPPGPGKGGNYIAIIVAISLPIGVAVLLYIIGFIAMRTRNSSDATPVIDEDYITTEDSLQLDLRTIKAATHSFSESNKLGEGDFGEVYKGTIFNGVDIAVKRLEKSSGLSEVEFKNEVTLLAKLQHRNLVRLLGFCLQGEERILVYECLPNESLDVFLFDHAKKGHLNWAIWYKIIEGIARGMLYLHQDSRLAVIHSNLKASNILLDIDMNPKLADFGMARLFGTEQSQENTSIIVGRSGYMSTEYAMHNLFSMKSDIYSFGVLLLEIINGRKNRSLYQTDKDSANDLIKYAWRLWRNGTPLELVDPAIGDNYHRNEVIRCIQIGLLCVQEDHVHRPIFSTIVMMLTCNTNTLPEPQEPCSPFLWRPEREKLDKSKSDQTIQCCVDDDASITNLYPR